MALEKIIHVLVKTIEDRISHSSRDVSHHSKVFQVATVRIVRERDELMARVVKVAIEIRVGTQNGRFDNVTQKINATIVI